jgi:NIPSNAP
MPTGTKRVVEIRSYRLKPGTGAAFHALVRQHSLPLLAAVQMDVVAYGPSLHDPDAYYLIRSYESLEHLKASQDAFYSSAAWRQGPREAIIALIVSDANAVMWLDREALEALRQSHGRAP